LNNARVAATRGSPDVRSRPPLASGKQRFAMVLALVVLGLASSYAAIATLARVTPVVVRGKDLTDLAVVSTVIDPIPKIIQPSAPAPNSIVNRRVNLLVFGVDKRDWAGTTDDEAYNTDTLMVATIDPVSETVSVLSFPRDLWVDIHRPGNVVYKDRINASYATGFQDAGTIDSGAQQLMTDLKLDFGIQIDNWVWLDFTGVEKLIDSVGGITLDIPDDLAVTDPWYYTDDDRTNPHYETFPAGKNELNGYRAVAFGRYREDSDLNRVKRQQLVISAALTKVFSNGLLNTNPADLYDTYTSMLHTDMSTVKAASLLPLVKDTGGQVSFFSLGDPVDGQPTVFDYVVPGSDAQVLEYDPLNAQYWVAQAFTKSQYAKSTVELASGLGTADSDDQLRTLSLYLRFQKYLPTVQLAPDIAPQAKTAIVLYSENRRPMAEDIAGWLRLPTSVIALQPRTSDSQPDIRIELGQDYRPPVN
jgi:LCP family protein required for cell wall assembly